ncbi:MAG: hypothetical protein ACRDJ9_25400, partial [Dehalococcoidia bacterium]
MLLAFGVDLGLIALHVVNLQGITPAGRPLRFFDVDDEVNLPTWWASVQLFSIGLLLGLVAVRRAPRAWIARIGLWVLAAAFFGMSLDEFAQLHERLGQATRTGVLPVTGAWPLILGPLALVVIGGALLAARPYLRDPQALAIMAGGLVLYVVAAAGIELTLNAVALGSVEHEL